MELTLEIKSVIKNAAKKLTGFTKRKFMAETTQQLLEGNARQAERVFGWSRATIKKGYEN